MKTRISTLLPITAALVLTTQAQPDPNANRSSTNPEDYRRFALSQQADATRGQTLFFNEAKLACSKCHSVDGKAGKAGPDLYAIGDKYPRPDLIQQILQPSANIAVGYTTTIVTTKGGDEYSGILQQLNDKGVELIGADAQVIRVPKADIKEQRSSSTSLMPEGLEFGLTRQEFNDLIEYLVTLRQPESTLHINRAMPAVIPELATPARVTPFFETRFTTPRIDGVESGLTGAIPIPGQPNAWLITHQVGYIWLLEKTGDGEKKSVFSTRLRRPTARPARTGCSGSRFTRSFLKTTNTI